MKKTEGVISINQKGVGYVKIPDYGENIEIDFRYLNTALHGDAVEIILHTKKRERATGEVLKIISRAKTGFSGVLELADASAFVKTSADKEAWAGKKEHGIYFLRPDDAKMYTDILIPEKFLNSAKAGQKVYAEIISWKDPLKAPEGKVIKILGRPGDNNAEMKAIALEKGFDSDFPREAEKEAEEIEKSGIKNEDWNGRRDFRKTVIFTIDPEDAKDFDDAISFQEIGKDEYEIGVHIADVSHYVKIGSELDREARKRGTSVYLVDRTIPMLPEALSNNLCSLLPHKDRLAMSAVFVLDKNARARKEWYGKTLIRSQKRFTYEEAENSIIASTAIRRKGGKIGDPYHQALFILNDLAKKLTKERFANGAIALDQEEVKFILDKNGTPIKIIKKERGDSNRLVEEFMLLANRKVAEKISLGAERIKGREKRNGVFVYRVHENPSKEKMADLAFFLRSLGHKVSLIDGIIPNYEINKILNGLENKNEGDAVHRAVIRSMAKAIYSTKNIGHYGLAFKHYAHFTSPIRRYPDIVAHRLLDDYLKGLKVGKDKLGIYEEISISSSRQEKSAADAERASIKYKQVEYMSARLGKVFNGIISGVAEWGIYVEETETKCEGLVRARDLKDDFYVFNEKRLELAGQKNKKKYRLGDKLKIKVKNVDLERKTIDYALA